MARRLAQSSPHRKAPNGIEVASAWLAPLLVVAIADEATDWPSGNSPTASSSHPTKAAENKLWGQKRIQAELARLGFKVSARTVAEYMQTARHDRGPSVHWRTFLKLHASNIWACDFFCVQTLLFETLHVFFVIEHINREVLHIAVTRHPTAGLAQQIVDSCAWDRRPPR
jgi:putative transposase